LGRGEVLRGLKSSLEVAFEDHVVPSLEIMLGEPGYPEG